MLGSRRVGIRFFPVMPTIPTELMLQFTETWEGYCPTGTLEYTELWET